MVAIRFTALATVALISLMLIFWNPQAIEGMDSALAQSPLPTPVDTLFSPLAGASGTVSAPTDTPVVVVPPPNVTGSTAGRDWGTFIAVAALVSSIVVPVAIETAKWMRRRGRLDLIISLAQTTLARWSKAELEYELREVHPLVYSFVCNPLSLAGHIRTAFSVLEFTITNLYGRPLVVNNVVVEPNEGTSFYKMSSHAPPSATRLKAQDNYWVFDLDSRKPVSLAEPIILKPGESVGRRIEFLIWSTHPAAWMGTTFFPAVPDERIFSEARITVITSNKVHTSITSLEVVDYYDVDRELREVHQAHDPRSLITTWRTEYSVAPSGGFPRPMPDV